MNYPSFFRMQIRTRLTVQFVLITAGIFFIALAFIYLRFRQYSEGEYYILLEGKAYMTANMVLKEEKDLRQVPLPRPGSRDFSLPYSENITLYDDIGRRVFTTNISGRLQDNQSLLDIRRHGRRLFKENEFQVFGMTVKAPSGKDYIVVAEGVFDQSKLRRLGAILAFSFLIAVSAVAAGGYFFAGQALRPMSRVVREVEAILPTDLSRRLHTGGQQDEFSQMMGTINRLLDRIEPAFRMQRSFISNVSHEIKNPLAAMDAQLQLALQRERSVEEYRKVLESLHDDVRFISDTAEKLLQLAKIHSEPASIVFTPVRFDELVLQTRDMLLKANPNYVAALEMREMPEREEWLDIEGNEPLLRTALLNLMENGCKFSPDHRVHVRVRFKNDGKHEVEIQDQGPGIPREDLKKIFDPFFRSPRHAGVKGSGIGLSLAQSIFHLHQVAVEVLSEEGKGSLFRLKFSGIRRAAPAEQSTTYAENRVIV